MTVKEVNNTFSNRDTQKTEEGSSLTPEEIEHFRQQLLAMRGELLGDMGQMEGQTLNSNRQDTSGELSHMPVHMADVGT